MEVPAKPAPSKEGKSIPVQMNLFKVSRMPNLEMNHYSLKVEPEVKDILLPFLFKAVVSSNPAFEGITVGFDNARMVVLDKKLPSEISEFIAVAGKKEFKLTFTFFKAYHTDEIEDFYKNKEASISSHIQCLELLMRAYQVEGAYQEKGRTATPENFQRVGRAIEIWTGIVQSMKMLNIGICLNPDLVFIPFIEALPLHEVVANLMGSRGPIERLVLSRDDALNIGRILKNVKVFTTHRPQKKFTFKIFEFTGQDANTVTFNVDGKDVPVAEYFEQTYQRLKYPNLPCVAVKRGGNTIFFPTEVLQVAPAQKYAKKLDDVQISKLIRIAAAPPKSRFSTIRNKVRDLKIIDNPIISKMGIQFENNFVQANGRVIEPPMIEFKDGVKVEPIRGSWDLRNVKAIQSTKIIKTMHVISLVPKNVLPEDMLRDKIHNFLDISGRFGLDLPNNFNIGYVNPSMISVESLGIGKSALIMVILPSKSAKVYNEVKKTAEAQGQFSITQCITYDNLNKLAKPAFSANVAIKVNAKAGGINSRLISLPIVKDKPTIVFGLDVFHPGVGENAATVSAVVSSMDQDCTKFFTTTKVQNNREDIIQDLDKIIVEGLKAYYKNTKSKPERIIFYRDGVSESQFDVLIENEVNKIKNGCKQLDSGYNPEITFILAQKRHTVRFLAEGTEKGNVPPGTIVDEIGHPALFEFYMVSHHALQGTARPVLYQVLKNESNFKASEIQNLTYAMCHLYSRATKSVSVCAPIYFAHLAAARAKLYVNEEKTEMVEIDKKYRKLMYYL